MTFGTDVQKMPVEYPLIETAIKEISYYIAGRI